LGVILWECTWGGENRSISDDFGDETDTTFVPWAIHFSRDSGATNFVSRLKRVAGALHISPGQRPGFMLSPFGAKAKPEFVTLVSKT
jgi:hypothetical protein